VANIRTYASRLRKLIVEATGQDLIVGRVPGYLVAAGESVDLVQFQRQAEAGRTALSQGDAALAALNFGEALRLWRGTAAEDVERSAGLAAQLSALDGQRLLVMEEWVTARQGLRHDPELVTDLRRLTGRHPLREKLWAQLMTALYREGDPAGALEAFASARFVLGDQLGIDPGQELVRLQRAILAREELAHELPAPVSIASGPVPRELPAVAALTGRDKDFAMVLDEIASHRIVAIHGTGGAGKSALALAAAHELASAYPDGQLYLDLHGATSGLPPQPVAAVLNRMLRTLGVAPGEIPGSVDEAAARFRSLAAGRRMILVLDNAVSEAQVRPLLPGSPACAVLITSRQLLAGLDQGVHLELGPLSQDAAVSLLRRLAGADRAAAEPGEVERMAGLCGRLPLALRIAGARLAARPRQRIADLNGQLEQSRLDTLAYGELALRSCLAISVRDLSEPARKLFALLGLLRLQELRPLLAASLSDVELSPAHELLDELAAARLLEQTGPDEYHLHDLVRLYAVELARSDDEALHRVFACYLTATRQADDLRRPGMRRGGEDEYHFALTALFDNPEAGLVWLHAQRANLLMLARQASEYPAHDRFVHLLLLAMYQYLSTHWYWDDLMDLADLAATVAVRTGNVREEATAMVCQAMALRYQHRLPEALACLHRVRELRERIGEQGGVAGVLSHLGLAYAQAGDLAQALSYLDQSIERHRQLGLTIGTGIAHNDAADVLCQLGRLGEAREHLVASLRIRRQTGDRIGEAITLVGTGKVAVLQGEPATAIAVLTGAIGLCQAAGVPVYEWLAWLWRALAYWQLAEPAQALEDLREAARLCAARQDHRAAAVTDGVRGRLGHDDPLEIAATVAAYKA
jgi:DNA-binding SARP family transcriptional activator